MEDGFEKGLVFAATWLISGHDLPTIAKELLDVAGMDFDDIKRLDIDEQDREVLEKLFSDADS